MLITYTKKIIICLSLLLLVLGCAKTDEEETEIEIKKKISDYSIKCLRWVDRGLKFAYQDRYISNLNNDFHVLKLQSTIKNLERSTSLGENHFLTETITPNLMSTNFHGDISWEDSLSFMQVWPDKKFETLVTQKFGSIDNLADPNVLIVENPFFKRKFYMIFRASCFESSQRCSDSEGEVIGNSGINALIWRQFGFLFGLQPADCDLDPTNIMCNEPSDLQWNDESVDQFK